MILFLRIILLLLVFGTPLSATARQNAELPDLAPRVVEITGDLSISFPSLRRQPLIGFNPPPRVPDIESGRRPFTEPYKQPSASLPPSPLHAPQPPKVSTVSSRVPSRRIAIIGTGRYFERLAGLRGNENVARNTTLNYDLAYRASDGIQPFPADPSIETASNRTRAHMGFHRKMGGVNVGVNAAYNRHEYSLFGVSRVTGTLSLANPRRLLTDKNVSLSVSSDESSDTRGAFALSLGSSDVDTDVFDPSVRKDPTTRRSEDRFRSEASLVFPVGFGSVHVHASGQVQGLDRPGIGRTIQTGQVGIAYRFDFDDRTRVRLGIRFVGFDASGQGVAGADRTLTYLAPDIRIDYRIARGISGYLAHTADVENLSLSSLFIRTPYIQDRPQEQPEITPTNLTGGVDFYGERIHGTLSIGWLDIRNKRYIENPLVPDKGYRAGYFNVAYENASQLRIGGTATLALSPNVSASIFGGYTRSRLDISDVTTPYVSPYDYGASTHIGLWGGRIILKALARGENARYVDRLNTTQSGSVFRIDGDITYFLTENAGIVVGGRNMGGSQRFWENYEPEADVVFAALRWRW